MSSFNSWALNGYFINICFVYISLISVNYQRQKLSKNNRFLEIKGIISKCSSRIIYIFYHNNYNNQIIMALRNRILTKVAVKYGPSFQIFEPVFPRYLFCFVVHVFLQIWTVQLSKESRNSQVSNLSMYCWHPF